jgi:hypothetical protein
MIGHGAKFAQKMELAIAALLSHKSVEDAARAVDLSTNTLLRWMKEPEFQKKYQEACRLVFSQSLGRLQETSGAAVTTVLKIMVDPNAPPGIRLKAAEIVLEQAAKAVELENRFAKGKRKERRKTNPCKVTVVETTPLLCPPPTQAARDINPTDADKDGVTP